MTTQPRPGRRTDALSKERIVEAAIEILDHEGEDALTFRSLGARLATGSGAIYHHLEDKADLLAAATDDIIAGVVTDRPGDATAQEAVRVLALGVFDAIDRHPWVGSQLARAPWQPAMLRIFEGIGAQIQTLGMTEPLQFDCASAVLNYILGLAGQHAASARLIPRGTDRSAFLATAAAQWAQLDPDDYPFARQAARHLAEHDDRKQFLAGIELILAGIETLR